MKRRRRLIELEVGRAMMRMGNGKTSWPGRGLRFQASDQEMERK